MRYQAQVFLPYQQRWIVLNGLQSCMANAIRTCWCEQQLWARNNNQIIPDCRIAMVNGNVVDTYANVPYDPDFMVPECHNDEIVLAHWRLSVECHDDCGKVFDAMMART